MAMRARRIVGWIVGVVASVGVVAIGCGGGSADTAPPNDTLDGSIACGTSQDPATLGPSCCDDGPAHCIDGSNVPAALQSGFNTCATSGGPPGLCLPDKIIHAGQSFTPASCVAAIGNSPGVCLSKCIGKVANDPSAKLLSRDACEGADEVCVPCINPINKTSTGACDIHGSGCGIDAGPPSEGGGFDGGSACPYTGPPIIDPNKFPECGCAGAHCLPVAYVPPAQQSQLAACGSGSAAGFCTPDDFIKSGGNGLPASCKSVAGSEGRCLSTCLPQIASQATLLSQGTCKTNERCAPCFNPTAADPKAPTGACGLACDKPKDPPTLLTCPYTGPPVIDPSTFPACTPACGGAHCVPKSLVPASQQAQLAACGSGQSAGFCAPDSITSSGGAGVPAKCVSIAGAEGRCVSTCLPQIAAQATLLPQATCKSDERCAPCFNPTATDPRAPTGACSLACDKPVDPPTILACPYTGPPVIDPSVFPACAPACGGSHCVPAALVPQSQQSQLATCTGGFCAPDAIVSSAGHWVPTTCTSIAGAEGRCLSTCLPAIAAQAGLLPQATCAANERCAPCFNPTATDPRAATGACSLACDAPTKPPTVLTCPWTGPPVIDPNVFPACAPACGGAHCVPASLIPVAQQSQLATCNGGFCAPDPIVSSGGNWKPPTCAPFTGTPAEGRCLSDCLPSIQAQSAQLAQQTCNAGSLCAPCTDPIKGTSTGACTLACDAPTTPPFTFPLCCDFNGGTQGTCLPSALIPSGQQTNLRQDVCPGGAANYLCVPEEYLPNPPIQVSTCTTLLGRGTCISNCVSITLGGVFGQGACPDNHKCVPCALAGSTTPGCQ